MAEFNLQKGLEAIKNERIRAIVTSATRSGILRQKPTSPGGSRFERSSFQRNVAVDSLRAGLISQGFSKQEAFEATAFLAETRPAVQRDIEGRQARLKPFQKKQRDIAKAEAEARGELVLTPQELAQLKAEESVARQKETFAKQRDVAVATKIQLKAEERRDTLPTQISVGEVQEAELTPQTFTPGAEITAAPTELRARTFFTPQKQAEFEREGNFFGKAKSFVSGAGQLVVETGKTIIGEFPGAKEFKGQKKKGLTPIQAGFTSFFITTPKAKTEFAKEQLTLVGPAIARGVKKRPFAFLGQLVLTELGFRGIRKIKTKVIEAQPTSVRLGTKGEIVTVPSPTEKGTKISIIKPVDFVAEVSGTRIAGTGEGRAVTKTGGDIISGFKFKTRAAKAPPSVTEIATKGKIQQVDGGVRAAAISEIETVTPRRKTIRQKAITLAKAEQISFGELPTFVTGGLEFRKGRFRVVPTAEPGVLEVGRVAEPRFVRAGIVQKEAELFAPVGVTTREGAFAAGLPTRVEKFTFLEKGISRKAAEQELKKRKKRFQVPFTEGFLRGLEARRILRGKEKVSGQVFQVGGLVPPVQIPKPKVPLSKITPEPIIAQDFLKGIRKAIQVERIAQIPKIKGGALTGPRARIEDAVSIKPIQVQRDISKIKPKIESALKPIVETKPRQAQEAGVIAALRPAVAAKPRLAQRATTIQALKAPTGFTPLSVPSPIPRVSGGRAFIPSIPKRRRIEEEPKEKNGKFKRKFKGVPSLSVILGGSGTILTKSQVAGTAFISPFQIRELPGMRKSK